MYYTTIIPRTLVYEVVQDLHHQQYDCKLDSDLGGKRLPSGSGGLSVQVKRGLKCEA